MAKMILTRELYLIRHGESFCNIEGFKAETFIDKHDPELTENGICQAKKLGEYHKNEDYDYIFCSPLRRAAMTAVEFLGDRNQPLYAMPDLCEIGVSPEYVGVSYDELKKYSPRIVPAKEYEEYTRTAVPDETPRENEERYFKRAKRVLDYIDRYFTKGEKIALVSHAGFLTYIIFYLFGYRDKEPNYDMKISNTGVTKISFYEPGTNPNGDVIFDYVNNTSHLVK